MWERIVKWYRNKRYAKKLEKYLDPAEAYRRVLGIVSLYELEIDMPEGERREYVARATSLKDIWDRELKNLLVKQIETNAHTLNNTKTQYLHFGAMNAGELMLERMNLLVAEHNEYVEADKPEEADPLAPLISGSKLDI